MNSAQQKILRTVLHEVAHLTVEQRIAILRMALGLTVQRQHDDEAWRPPQEKESENAARTH